MIKTRLWHQDLIEKLPQKQLSGQWREVIALLGKGWGKKHSTVNYVFEHDRLDLLLYGHYVYQEAVKRGYKYDYSLLGKAMYRDSVGNNRIRREMLKICRNKINNSNIHIYPEHNNDYLKECLDNLKSKGIIINI